MAPHESNGHEFSVEFADKPSGPPYRWRCECGARSQGWCSSLAVAVLNHSKHVWLAREKA